MIGCVLHMQGDVIRQQPAVDSADNVLLWNGEVFGGLEYEGSDTDKVLYELGCIVATNTVGTGAGEDVVEAVMSDIATLLASINGPFAFVFYAKALDLLIFGRDPFGRRSLLLAKDAVSGRVTGVTSVAPAMWLEVASATCCEEVNIKGIFGLRVASAAASICSDEEQLLHCPWPSSRVRLQRPLVVPPPRTASPTPADEFLTVLTEAVRCRLRALAIEPRVTSASEAVPAFDVGVLFSGGIDSVVLAVLLHMCVAELELEWAARDVHCRFAIDLLNVSFYSSFSQSQSPDRIAAIVAYGELRGLFPGREWRLVHVDVSDVERQEHTAHIRQLILPSATHMDLNIGTAFWFAARGRGVVRADGCDYAADEITRFMEAKDECGRPLLRVGEDDAATGVGLTNWSQWKPKGAGAKKPPSKRAIRQQRQHEGEGGEQNDEGDHMACPGERCRRIAKPKCVHGMCKRCCLQVQKEQLHLGKPESGEVKLDSPLPCRVHKCSFGAISTPVETADSSTSPATAAPDDESLAALETPSVAEEAQGALSGSNTEGARSSSEGGGALQLWTEYATGTRALLIGIGADEQMGGYGRHRSAFVRGAHAESGGGGGGEECGDGCGEGQFAELTRELNKDLARLWERNLGRDDRCIGDHGRESWSPFLDENVVLFLQGLHLADVCSLHLPPGEGDKKVLRDVAKLLGLKNTAAAVKRAIQFGTRIAKQMNMECHGSNRKGSGTTTL
jgi:asparagine synthetase B (glutamine-hydrolysing)